MIGWLEKMSEVGFSMRWSIGRLEKISEVGFAMTQARGGKKKRDTKIRSSL